MTMSIFITSLLFLIGLLCSYFAVKRGRDPYVWFAIGMVFGLLGLITLFLLSPLNSPEDIQQEGLQVADDSPSDYKNIQEKQWFYAIVNQPVVGPIDFAALKELWKNGAINRSVFVWTDGMEQWSTIEKLPSLQHILNE